MKKLRIILLALFMIFLISGCNSENELNIRKMEGFLDSFEMAVESLGFAEFHLEKATLEELTMKVNGIKFVFLTDKESDEIMEIRMNLETALVGEEGKEAELQSFVQGSELLLKTLHPDTKDEELEKLLEELNIANGTKSPSSVIYNYEDNCYVATMVEGHKPVFRVEMQNLVQSVEEMEIVLSFEFGDRGGSYSGDMVNDLPDGFGRFNTTNDTDVEYYYEGFFKEGHFEGYGRCVWPDLGQIKEGDYRNDQLNGYGKLIYDGKLYYTGDYIADNFEGQGTLYQSDGTIAYTGTFSNNIPKDAEDFKAACTRIPYDELERNPDAYIRAAINFSGEVLQVVEQDNNNVRYRLATNGGSDVVLLYYERTEGERRILEGDVINVWGISQGLIQYRSASDIQVSVPSMTVYFMDAN